MILLPGISALAHSRLSLSPLQWHSDHTRSENPFHPQRGWGRQPPYVPFWRHSKGGTGCGQPVTAFGVDDGTSIQTGVMDDTRRPQRCIPPRTSPAQAQGRCPLSRSRNVSPEAPGMAHDTHGVLPAGIWRVFHLFPRHPPCNTDRNAVIGRFRYAFPGISPEHLGPQRGTPARRAESPLPLRSPPHEGIHRDTADRAYAGKVCLPRQDVPGT